MLILESLAHAEFRMSVADVDSRISVADAEFRITVFDAALKFWCLIFILVTLYLKLL